MNLTESHTRVCLVSVLEVECLQLIFNLTILSWLEQAYNGVWMFEDKRMRRVMCYCAGNKTNWDHQYHLENTWFKNSKSGWSMTVGVGNDDHFKVLMKVWLMKTLLPPTQLVYIQHKMKSRSDSAYREYDASIKNYYTTFTVLQLPFYDCWLVAADPNCSSTQHWFWRTIWSSWWCWRHRKGRGCYYWLWYPLLCSARSCFFGVLIRLNGNDCRILNWLLMAQFFHHRTIFIWNSYIQCSDVQTRPFAPDILNNVDTVVGVVFRHSKCWIKYCSKTWFAWDRADRE